MIRMDRAGVPIFVDHAPFEDRMRGPNHEVGHGPITEAQPIRHRYRNFTGYDDAWCRGGPLRNNRPDLHVGWIERGRPSEPLPREPSLAKITREPAPGKYLIRDQGVMGSIEI